MRTAIKLENLPAGDTTSGSLMLNTRHQVRQVDMASFTKEPIRDTHAKYYTLSSGRNGPSMAWPGRWRAFTVAHRQ